MTPESYTEACEDLHATVSAASDALGPTPDALLAEWVLVAAWVDPHTGALKVTSCVPPGSARHHTEGLLHVALYADTCEDDL